MQVIVIEIMLRNKTSFKISCVKVSKIIIIK